MMENFIECLNNLDLSILYAQVWCCFWTRIIFDEEFDSG